MNKKILIEAAKKISKRNDYSCNVLIRLGADKNLLSKYIRLYSKRTHGIAWLDALNNYTLDDRGLKEQRVMMLLLASEVLCE